MSSQYGELRPTSGWDLLARLGHPGKFQRVSRLGSVTARHCSSEHQPNFVGLNRGSRLYLAGRPSRWALAHILVSSFFPCLISVVADWMSTIVWPWCGLCANLECRSEMCCVWLAEIQAAKIATNLPSGHHHTNLSGCIFATKA